MRHYDRSAAVAYAERWALSRNPAYYNFDALGGDCTNFASQCLLAGGAPMNRTPELGWFYESLSQRSAAWTSVNYLYRFLVNNHGVGPGAVETTKEQMLPGDLIQLANADGIFYHSLVVLSPSLPDLYVAAHTLDALWRPLSTYQYDKCRYLHIFIN